MNKKITGITVGAFDLCHAGHFLVFKEAKENCDHLIVGLQEDPSITDKNYRGKKKNKPIMSLKERQIVLEGIKYIDEIFTYTSEEDLFDKLQKIKYDIRFIGEDWKGKKYTGHDLPHKIFYNKRDHGYSTTELRDRIHKAEKAKQKNKR
ncbi:MAG: adenylyltransferase/cytidyltransferase family protein [Candidatus Paceibacterota bacterium]